MSVRLKGFLAGHAQSRQELGYLSGQDGQNVTMLTDFPCEMTFVASDLFVEHESEQHHYLPYLHFVGQITELRGNFPHQISSLYFGEEDSPSLKKDIYYYPTPDELAHLIQHGKLYSNDFEPSAILGKNTYSLPVQVDLSVIAPDNELMYAGMVRQGMSLSDVTLGLERTNIPIVYVDIKGSGVNKETDKTIAYYGLDFEEDFPLMVMTAESSGYTNPPLCSMDYWPEPEVKEFDMPQDMADYYITPQEEAELMRAKTVQEAEPERVPEAQPQPVDYEDCLLAEADRQIANRVAERTKQRMPAKNMEASVEEERQNVSKPVVSEPVMDAGAFLSLGETEKPEKKLSQPDTREQMAEVKMDLNPEENAYVKADRDETSDMVSEDVLSEDMMDVRKRENADVSDARAQAKVNEANALDTAVDASVSALREKQDEKKAAVTKPTEVRSADGHCQVPQSMQDIADAYDAQHGAGKDTGFMELD